MLQGVLMGVSNQYSRVWTGLEITMWPSPAEAASVMSPGKVLWEGSGDGLGPPWGTTTVKESDEWGSVDKWRRLRALSPRECYLSLIFIWFYGGYCAKKNGASAWFLRFLGCTLFGGLLFTLPCQQHVCSACDVLHVLSVLSMTCVSSDFDLVWERWHLSKLVCRVAVPFSVPRGGGYPDSTRTVALKTRNQQQRRGTC